MARRTLGLLSGFWLACASVASIATAAQAEPRHGISAFGTLKYDEGFTHFDYVNPEAPKGGRLSTVGPGATRTFDSFNAFILKGDAAQGLSFMFDTLMERAQDEPDAMYGLVARTADVAPDGTSVTFELRPEAKFSDGSPLTAEDVAFSFTTLKEKGHPQYRSALRDVAAVEVIGPGTVKYTFTGAASRDLPLTVAGLPILSKAYYTANAFDATSLTPPLGSGPYKISGFKQGTFVTYARRDDYWAKDLNVNRGRFNFDEIRYEYFRDSTAALETFKAGDYDVREEFTSRNWATAYDIPQVRDGRIAKLVLPNESPSGAQGFFLNMRRDKFTDPRVRRALGLAFDFEWMNKNLFYGLYTRTASYFENSVLKAEGMPSASELALLEPFRDKLPVEVFGEPYAPPVSDGSGSDRAQLQQALKLMAEAGWKLNTETMDDPSCGFFCQSMRTIGLSSAPTQQVLRNGEGKTLDIEFLAIDPSFVRILNPYVQNLRAIGVQANVRRIDPAQYERRIKSFDFDVISQRFVMRLTPGVEMRNFFSSAAADVPGTFNRSGIKNEVIDALIEKALAADSRDDLLTAMHAMDRVLRAGHYWVPHWYKASHTMAVWDKFGRPDVKPKYARGILDTWWYDSAKAAKLGSGLSPKSTDAKDPT